MQSTRCNGNPARRVAWAAVFLGLLAALNGCSTLQTGRLQPDGEVRAAFSQARILEDHRYYFFGRAGEPEAIMAVHVNYHLISEIWTPVEFTPVKLKQWVYRMNFRHRGRRSPTGFRIVGPNDEVIGLWFSHRHWTTVILHEDNTVEIFPPPFGDPVNRERLPGKRSR